MSFEDDKTRLPGSEKEGASILRGGESFRPYSYASSAWAGCMAEVHKAEHQDLHPRHALKLINPEIVDRQAML